MCVETQDDRNFGANRVSRTFKPSADSPVGHLSLVLDSFNDPALNPTLTVTVHSEAIERCGLSKVFLRDAISDGRTLASALQELAVGFFMVKLGVYLSPIGSPRDPERITYVIDPCGKSFVDFSRALVPREEERENRLVELFYV